MSPQPSHPLTKDFDSRRTRFAAEKARKESALRQAWTEITGEALSMAERLIATDGEEAIEALDLKAKLSAVVEGGADGFPVQGASAAKAAMAFAQTLRALFDASLPRRRAILAPMVAAGARAVAELISEHQTRQADGWRKQLGEEA